jgi:hypothetical protein
MLVKDNKVTLSSPKNCFCTRPDSQNWKKRSKRTHTRKLLWSNVSLLKANVSKKSSKLRSRKTTITLTPHAPFHGFFTSWVDRSRARSGDVLSLSWRLLWWGSLALSTKESKKTISLSHRSTNRTLIHSHCWWLWSNCWRSVTGTFSGWWRLDWWVMTKMRFSKCKLTLCSCWRRITKIISWLGTKVEAVWRSWRLKRLNGNRKEDRKVGASYSFYRWAWLELNKPFSFNSLQKVSTLTWRVTSTTTTKSTSSLQQPRTV